MSTEVQELSSLHPDVNGLHSLATSPQLEEVDAEESSLFWCEDLEASFTPFNKVSIASAAGGCNGPGCGCACVGPACDC